MNSTFWMNLLQQVLIIVAPAIALALFVWLSALAAREWKYFVAKYPNWADLLEQYAPLVVQAAEQLRKSGVIPSAEDAKAYALKTLQTYLNAHGAGAIDVSLIEAAIEAEVGKLPPFVPNPVVPASASTTAPA